MTTLLFSCHVCNLIKCKVSVRERGKDEEIGTWLESILHPVNMKHQIMSPLCEHNQVDLFIPLGG